MMTFGFTIFKIMQELGQLNTATLGPHQEFKYI